MHCFDMSSVDRTLMKDLGDKISISDEVYLGIVKGALNAYNTP